MSKEVYVVRECSSCVKGAGRDVYSKRALGNAPHRSLQFVLETDARLAQQAAHPLTHSARPKRHIDGQHDAPEDEVVPVLPCAFRQREICSGHEGLGRPVPSDLDTIDRRAKDLVIAYGVPRQTSATDGTQGTNLGQS